MQHVRIMTLKKSKMFKQDSKYELKKDLSLIALQGPKAETILEKLYQG